MATVQWGNYWQFYPESSWEVLIDFRTLKDSEVKLACETWGAIAEESYLKEDSRKRYAQWAEAAYAELVSRRLVS